MSIMIRTVRELFNHENWAYSVYATSKRSTALHVIIVKPRFRTALVVMKSILMLSTHAKIDFRNIDRVNLLIMSVR